MKETGYPKTGLPGTPEPTTKITKAQKTSGIGETGASVSSPVHLQGRIEREKEIHSLLKSAPADEVMSLT